MTNNYDCDGKYHHDRWTGHRVAKCNCGNKEVKLKHLVLDYINTIKNRDCYNYWTEPYLKLDEKARELEDLIKEKLEEEE